MVKTSLFLVLLSWGSGVWTLPDAEALKARYRPEVRQQYADYLQAYGQVKHAKDVQQVLQWQQDRAEIFSEPLQAAWQKHWEATSRPDAAHANLPAPDFSWVEAAFPGMVLANEAEGTVVILRPHWKALAQLAQRTPESDDDRLMALMLRLHGEQWSAFPTWMEQTWDYGGCSRLGSGRHTALLKAIRAQLQRKSLFSTLLQAEEKALVQDILEAPELCYAPALALKELKTLTTAFSWSSVQVQALRAQIQRIETGKLSSMDQELPADAF